MFHLQSVFSIISWICLILIVCTFNLNKCSVQVLTMLIKFATLNNIYLLNGVSIHSSLFLWFTMHRLFCDWSKPQIQWENNRLNSYKIQYRIEFWGFYPLIWFELNTGGDLVVPPPWRPVWGQDVLHLNRHVVSWLHICR